MTIFLTVLHVMVCLVLIVVVLLQRGKGAEVGAVFGGGGGSTVFGSRGAGNEVARHYSRLAMDLRSDLPHQLRHLAWLELDWDGDTDVDLADFAAFQQRFTGPR